MKQSTFNKLLDEYDLGWNDKVSIVVLNPIYKRKWFDIFNWFGKPKTYIFDGYLNYTTEDTFVSLNIPTNLNESFEGSSSTFSLVLDFDLIVSVKPINE